MMIGMSQSNQEVKLIKYFRVDKKQTPHNPYIMLSVFRVHTFLSTF